MADRHAVTEAMRLAAQQTALLCALVRDRAAPEPLDAMSVQEFCRRHSISRAHFYNLLKAGRAPRCMAVGDKRLISREAAAEWRRAREESSAQEAK